MEAGSYRIDKFELEKRVKSQYHIARERIQSAAMATSVMPIGLVQAIFHVYLL